ncbi:MAG: SMI1/KNR4 family protein [Thermoguttaceae bacterium]|nr:SMI1/KNR4 family protein [Thermoguttaceae bacterium]
MIEKYDYYSDREYYQATDEDILAFERYIGYALPKEYKEFVKMAGGKSPEPDCYPVKDFPDSSEYMDCQRFYGLFADSKPPKKRSFLDQIFSKSDDWRDGDVNDLYWNREVYKGRMPRNLLPIGYSSLDDQICLMLDGDQKGSIWFWDHEDERDEFSYENCYLLANSLGEFLDSFQRVSEE